ncbi:DUF349 domain-containing protein [Solimonas terrae]|uniref:DUF349 domain-containing protein n=1 Tax=Solimonas terrae TaxID=1396819 RepID=A0A6M2BUZ1_9GAMM|nr:DUF349 domain-containing protein [Solimonas terrae]NGY05757.1 DUF349 domain-containing protein [Solimonas terrae]
MFGKAPSLSKDPASGRQPASSNAAEPAPPRPSAAHRALASFAEEKALRSAIEARDVQAIAGLVVAGTSTTLRQAAANAIDDPDVLRQLIRDVRGGNDKHVYKILTNKRDVLLEQARKLEQLQAEIDRAANALERHSQRTYDATYSPRLERFERDWNAVAAAADPELREKARLWIANSRETVAEHERQLATQAAHERAAAEAAAEARRLREEQAQVSAAAATEQARILEEQKRALSEARQTEQQAARQIGDLIRKAHAALSDGSTTRAADVRRAIDEKLAEAPPLPAGLSSRIQQIDKQLDELKDWKSFSVAPKRTELIAEMESLIDAPFEPQALADRIKRLKDDWRRLNKGAGGPLDPAHEADSQRFQRAAQKAYQPCSEYFAAQALVREENLQRRDAVLARLTAFEAGTDFEQADWQSVIKVLRDAKQEWHQCSPVDRLAGRQQHEGFMAVCASLQGRLDAEYARNLKRKESLIEQARALLANDDDRKATDGVKTLQQQWRTAGLVPHKVDQRLWGEFRQHCDAVFRKRQQAFAACASEQENNRTQALALCEQIEKIAALEGAELLASTAALNELRSAFDALGEFPRAESRELRNRLDRGVERCKAAVARQHARDAEHAWSELFEAAGHVRAYTLAVTRHLDAAQLDRLKAAAESHMATVQQWPKGGLEALQQALAGAPCADLAANETALKTLCIRAEIQTDMPTPPEDQALRREYQLQRLVQNMGQGRQADAAPWDSMAIEWAGVGPVDEAAYAPLLQRFRRCRERAGS